MRNQGWVLVFEGFRRFVELGFRNNDGNKGCPAEAHGGGGKGK